MNVLYQEIGGRIQELRRLHHLTQEDLAEKLDVSVKHISSVERGTSSLSLEKLIQEDAEIPVKKTFEYAPEMIHAYLSGKPFRSNVNVPNTGLITNLPENAVVEVPCYTDSEGIHPCYVGDLPDQLAALNTTNILVHQQMAKAMVERRYEYIYEGVKLDPMTAAICTLSQINSMVDELIEANKEYLEGFH